MASLRAMPEQGAHPLAGDDVLIDPHAPQCNTKSNPPLRRILRRLVRHVEFTEDVGHAFVS